MAKKKLSPALAAALLIGAIIAIVLLSEIGPTGATITEPSQNASCLSACESDYNACLQKSSCACNAKACQAALDACKNVCPAQ